jgi:hypothetical protein
MTYRKVTDRIRKPVRTVCAPEFHNYGKWRQNFLTEKDYRTCRKCQTTELKGKDGKVELMFA